MKSLENFNVFEVIVLGSITAFAIIGFFLVMIDHATNEVKFKSLEESDAEMNIKLASYEQSCQKMNNDLEQMNTSLENFKQDQSEFDGKVVSLFQKLVYAEILFD